VFSVTALFNCTDAQWRGMIREDVDENLIR